MQTATDSAAPSLPLAAGFALTDAAAARINFICEGEAAGTKLRVMVQGGGCSGFQYHFDFDASAPASDDTVIEKEGASVVLDSDSLNLLNGSVLDYIETLGSAGFEIKNPHATARCGCGNSFAIG